MSRTPFILHDAPYGTERSHGALWLAGPLSKRQEQVKIFLRGDAASCAKAHQKVPAGHYNLESMSHDALRQDALRQGAALSACSSCMDARGITDDELLDGVKRGTLEQLADWTSWADRVLVF